MRIGTHNVNGIRASVKRGFTEFWAGSGADIVALQEVRCQIKDLPLDAFEGWHVSLDVGKLAGRNGVAVLTKQEPAAVRTFHGGIAYAVRDGEVAEITTDSTGGDILSEYGNEGRYVEVDLADAPLRIASLYLPKGAAFPYDGKDEEKYLRKMRFLEGLKEHLARSTDAAAEDGREFLIVGDFNIANTKLDIKNWRGNQKSEGFLPEEREWFDSILGADALIDVVRTHHGQVDGPYSWWSWRGKAFDNDAGWRIDYHLATPSLAAKVTDAWSAREEAYDQRLSDHCPVIADYTL